LSVVLKHRLKARVIAYQLMENGKIKKWKMGNCHEAFKHLAFSIFHPPFSIRHLKKIL